MTETTPSPSPATGNNQRDGRKRLILWGSVLALLAVVGLAVVLLLPDGSEPGKIPSPQTARLAALGPQVAELVSLLEQGEKTEYHARYRAVIPAANVDVGSMSIELWRSPPRLRQDVKVSAGGKTAVSAAYLLPDRAVGCSREGTGVAWNCSPIPRQGGTTETLARQLTQQASGGVVTVRNAKVAGLSVRCFTVPISQATAEICVTDEGIPARISSGGTKIELVNLMKEVSSEVFTPPLGG